MVERTFSLEKKQDLGIPLPGSDPFRRQRIKEEIIHMKIESLRYRIEEYRYERKSSNREMNRFTESAQAFS